MRGNGQAVLGLPVTLVVTLIVAAVSIAFIVYSASQVWQDTQKNQVNRELEKISVDAEIMFDYANEGTMKTIHVNFPGSLRLVVFGSLPLNTSSYPQNLSLDETTSNNYYFVMDDGTFTTFHSNARFSSNNTKKIALFYPGSYDLTLELVTTEGKTYVKVYKQ